MASFFCIILFFLVHLHQHNQIIAKISKSDVTKHTVLSVIPHDSDCYTQGLTFNDGFLYESCGVNGKSSVRKVNPLTGEILQQLKLDNNIFAEGLVVIGNLIYVLTWHNKHMLVIDKRTFELIGKCRYLTHTGEGWGLTFDGNHFIVSDGSSRITFFEVPNTAKVSLIAPFYMLKKLREIVVRDADKNEVKLLNELEWLHDGHIYANVWYKDFILKINVKDGTISELLDLHSLYPHRVRVKSADCLNGIAYNTTDNTFLLTGKLWPQYYKINVLPKRRKLPAAGMKNHNYESIDL